MSDLVKLRVIAIGVVFAVGLSWGPAHSEQTKTSLGIELNALQQTNSACRLSMLFSNNLRTPLTTLSLELVLFDTNGQVLTMLAANAGAFPDGKSRLKQFDLADRACASIGRILLNDVTKCEGGDLTPTQCTAAAKLTSRAAITFSY